MVDDGRVAVRRRKAGEGVMAPRRDRAGSPPAPDVGGRAPEAAGEGPRAAQQRDDLRGGEAAEPIVHAPTVTRFLSPDKAWTFDEVKDWPALQPVEMGARLRNARLALGLGDQKRAAARLGVLRSRWCNWENGIATMPPEMAVALVENWPALSLDYMLRGKLDGMPMWLVIRLAAAAEGVDLPPPEGGPPKSAAVAPRP